jgi:hypothetical protein
MLALYCNNQYRVSVGKGTIPSIIVFCFAEAETAAMDSEESRQRVC